MSTKVDLLAYSPNWHSEFENIRKDILKLDISSIKSVAHIGSTAIEGMSAKDIIDIQVGVTSFEHFEKRIADFESLGFYYNSDFKQDHIPFHDTTDFSKQWEKRFLSASIGRRPTNIHVRIINNENWNFALLFRDFLRADKSAAKAYLQIKERLAEHTGMDRKTYTLVKDPVCDLIYLLAKQWALERSWTPRPNTGHE